MNKPNKLSWAEMMAGAVARITWPLQGKRLSAVICAVLFVIGVAGGSLAWKKWGHLVAEDEHYRLTAENVDVTPQPAWIHSDVKAEVIRDGSLHELSLLDTQATVTIARAFKMHPWVANVERVRKHFGPKVQVQVQYREPVAVVLVPGGWLPIDAHGVLLPPDNFSKAQARAFPWISADRAAPAGPVGTPWGEQRVLGAARIAAALGQHWTELGLSWIIAPDSSANSSLSVASYELATRDGMRVLWGRAPGHETPNEPLAAEKIERLLRSPPASSSTGMPIDLRFKS